MRKILMIVSTMYIYIYMYIYTYIYILNPEQTESIHSKAFSYHVSFCKPDDGNIIYQEDESILPEVSS